jgi:hypothetical protein
MVLEKKFGLKNHSHMKKEDRRSGREGWKWEATIQQRLLEIIRNNYESNSSSQNRFIRWWLPLVYKHLLRPSHIQFETF